MRQRLIHENIVNVEAVMWQLQAHILKHVGAIDDRVHKEILALVEVPHLIPSELTALGEHVLVAHDGTRTFMHLLVYVVGNDQIGGVLQLHLKTQVFHDFRHGLFVKPVIRVDNLEIACRSVRQTGIHCRAVPSVFLMDGLDDIRITLLPRIGNLCGVILKRAIVDNKDLDIIAAFEKRLDALIHVLGRIVARYCKRNSLHEIQPILKSRSGLKLRTLDIKLIHDLVRKL